MRISTVMATVRLAGAKSNRDGIGGVIGVKSSLGKQSSTVHSGSSYRSPSDLVPLHASKIDSANASKQAIGTAAADRFLPLMKAGAGWHGSRRRRGNEPFCNMLLSP